MIIRPSAMCGFGMQWPMFIKPIVENSLVGLPTRFDRGGSFRVTTPTSRTSRNWCGCAWRYLLTGFATAASTERRVVTR